MEMLRKICVVFILNLTLVACQSCVTFDFENGFTENFDNERIVCSSFPLWNVGYYSDIAIDAPNELSATFVYPNPTMSCASSFEFEVDTSGVLEVNVIAESSNVGDQLVLLVQGVNPGANDVVIGQGTFVSTDGNPLSTGGAIFTIPITWTVAGTYNAYIALMGLAAEDSILLIDSFRYIPPTLTEDECVVYPNEETEENTTTEETEENTTTETTDENTTTEETDENTTTEETEENTTTETTDENTTTEETEENSTTEETEENTTGEETGESTTTENTDENTNTEETEENTTTESTVENTTTEETDENATTEETEENTTTETTDESTTTEETEENTTTEETEENTTTETTDENTTNEETDENTTAEGTEEDTTTEETDENTTTETTDENTSTEENTTTGTTDEDTTTEGLEEENSTDNPEELPTTTESRSFWNPITIAIISILCFILLCIICWFCYQWGKRNAVNEIEPDFDIENLPKPMIMPRVTKYYYEGSMGGKTVYPV